MTLVDIFEYVLNEHEFKTDKLESILNKTENALTKTIDKALEIF